MHTELIREMNWMNTLLYKHMFYTTNTKQGAILKEFPDGLSLLKEKSLVQFPIFSWKIIVNNYCLQKQKVSGVIIGRVSSANKSKRFLQVQTMMQVQEGNHQQTSAKDFCRCRPCCRCRKEIISKQVQKISAGVTNQQKVRMGRAEYRNEFGLRDTTQLT